MNFRAILQWGCTVFIDQGHRLSLEVNMNYIFKMSVDDGV